MSNENIEALRRTKLRSTGRRRRLPRILAPDAEFQDLANAPDQSPASRAALTLWRVDPLEGGFRRFRADVGEDIDRGDVVICATHWQGRARPAESRLTSTSSTSTSSAREASSDWFSASGRGKMPSKPPGCRSRRCRRRGTWRSCVGGMKLSVGGTDAALHILSHPISSSASRGGHQHRNPSGPSSWSEPSWSAGSMRWSPFVVRT